MLDAVSKKIRSCHNSDMRPKHTHSCYIGTNEQNLSPSKKLLESIEKPSNSCHIGISGWHNFDIMAYRKSDRAIIFDYNLYQVIFMRQTLIAISENPTRQEFVDNIKEYIEYKINEAQIKMKDNDKCVCMIFFPNISNDPSYQLLHKANTLEEVTYELHRTGSWLASDDAYAHIRQLIQTDKIAIFGEDIRRVQTFARVKNLLRNNDISVDTLYLSNVHDWCIGSKSKLQFNRCVSCLADDSTLIIEADKDLNLYYFIIRGKKNREKIFD